MKKFINEFKTFISRGNVLDLAVGVIIGGAFNTIVNSLVNDIFMLFVPSSLCVTSVVYLPTSFQLVVHLSSLPLYFDIDLLEPFIVTLPDTVQYVPLPLVLLA